MICRSHSQLGRVTCRLNMHDYIWLVRSVTELIDGKIMLHPTDLIIVQIKKRSLQSNDSQRFKSVFKSNAVFYQHTAIFHAAVTPNSIPYQMTERNLPPITGSPRGNPPRDAVLAGSLKCTMYSLAAIRSAEHGNTMSIIGNVPAPTFLFIRDTLTTSEPD